MRLYLESFYQLFFPNTCVVCQRSLLKHEKCLCSYCDKDVPRSYFHLKSDNPTSVALWGVADVERAASFMLFQKGNMAQKLLHQLKYKNNKQLGEYLGELYAKELLELNYFDDIDGVIPVPLHAKKLQKRGYNQSYHIALGIRKVTGLELMGDALLKVENVESQTKKGRYDRYLSAQQVYVQNSMCDLKGKHILLVDDVFTTGATIEACYRALATNNNVKVSVITLAYAA